MGTGLYGVFVTNEIGLITFFLLQGAIHGFGKFAKNKEDAARDLDVWDESAKIEYEDICYTWVKKPFPDF